MPKRKSSGRMKHAERQAKTYESLSPADYAFARSLIRRKDLFDQILPRLSPADIKIARKIIANSILAILGRAGKRGFFTYFACQYSKDWDEASLKEWVEQQISEVGTTRAGRERLRDIFEKAKKGGNQGLDAATSAENDVEVDGKTLAECFEKLDVEGKNKERETVVSKDDATHARLEDQRGGILRDSEMKSAGVGPGFELQTMPRLAEKRVALLVVGKGRPAPGAY